MRPVWDVTLSGMDIPVHRKIWEWAFIAATLERHHLITPGLRGLGFGVGKEPLVSLFASQGCLVTASDQSVEEAVTSGWTASNQFAGNVNRMNEHGLCDPELFDRLVNFRTVDMRNIPDDLRDFDFTWSSCAFEHLGTIEDGIGFIVNQTECLRPGGLAVHTTEFNVSSNAGTISSGSTVLFREKDLKLIAKKLKRRGNSVTMDFRLGTSEFDRHVDRPPWSGAHLRLEHEGYEVTSYAVVVRKGTRSK